MEDSEDLAALFEAQRPQLRAVAYRLLGSLSEADDAVQETWLRLSRTDARAVTNLGGWLTTGVARVCLNVLRSRAARREQPLGVHVPDPVVSRPDGLDPEHEALVADAVGLALLVVLDTLTPAERLAFVLHDMFAVPFDEIAPVVGCSTIAARQLASRARRRVRQAAPTPDADLVRQWAAVDAFFAASRDGDFTALVAVLDPDVVLRADGGAARPGAAGLIRGAATVAEQALAYARMAPFVRRALVNGAAGIVVAPRRRPVSVMGFTVTNGKIVAMDVLADPARLARLGLWSSGGLRPPAVNRRSPGRQRSRSRATSAASGRPRAPAA